MPQIQTGWEFTEEEFAKYRKSYKCISWIFDHTGMPCSMDEAGEMAICMRARAKAFMGEGNMNVAMIICQEDLINGQFISRDEEKPRLWLHASADGK